MSEDFSTSICTARDTSLEGGFLGSTEDSAVVTKNIILPQEDQGDSDIAWEWRRLYLAADGGVWDLLCCPEDVTPPFGIYFKLMCPHGPSINGIIHGTHMLVYAISYTTYTLGYIYIYIYVPK